MTKVKSITMDIKQNTLTKSFIFKCLIFSIIVVFSVYLYFIGTITFNVLARKTIENNIRTLGNNVSQLELVYLTKTSELDKNYALSNGFVEVKNNIFASKDAGHVAISR